MIEAFATPAWAILKREWVRFYRQPSRLIGALATPLFFWLLFGSGMGSSFTAGASNEGYLKFFFPGSVLLSVFFTAIFSSISLIEDRREGFLQSVLVAPVSPLALAVGKIGGCAVLGWVQGLLCLLLLPFIGYAPSLIGLLWAIALIFAISLFLAGVGFLFAWRLESVQGFHSVMNLVLMPAWFLSGALFPISGAPAWMQWVMRLNPLYYALEGLRSALLNTASVLTPEPWPYVALFVTALFGLLVCLLAARMTLIRNAGSLT